MKNPTATVERGEQGAGWVGGGGGGSRLPSWVRGGGGGGGGTDGGVHDGVYYKKGKKKGRVWNQKMGECIRSSARLGGKQSLSFILGCEVQYGTFLGRELIRCGLVKVGQPVYQVVDIPEGGESGAQGKTFRKIIAEVKYPVGFLPQ